MGLYFLSPPNQWPTNHSVLYSHNGTHCPSLGTPTVVPQGFYLQMFCHTGNEQQPRLVNRQTTQSKQKKTTEKDFSKVWISTTLY